ncbi:hypothetical protein RPQ02_01080 [Streptomyces sp. AM2-3-1]|nr:hypothetical protein [Streptomyces sp. AM2-3-1]WNO69642.1 hypothetical protein RPQ02_01080 [Streptomyces sp. AM2-3-1]
MGRPEVPLPHPEITYIGCARCGTQIVGLDGRYACAGCGWVNDWSEGHSPLPGTGAQRELSCGSGALPVWIRGGKHGCRLPVTRETGPIIRGFAPS